jgi:ribosome modulation factor
MNRGEEDHEAHQIHSRENRSTKACNISFREGFEAKLRGLSQSACPYFADDSYTTYLRAYWLNGYNSPDGVNHHAMEQSPR